VFSGNVQLRLFSKSVNLTKVGSYLVKLSPDLNAKNYGFLRLKELVVATGIVELKM
jgi:hypothetical protein